MPPRVQSDLLHPCGAIAVNCQPRRVLACGALRGAEATVVLPIPHDAAAERCTLFRRSIEAACREALSWDAQGSTLIVSLDIRPQALRDGRLVDDVEEALARSGLPAERLEIELPEAGVTNGALGECGLSVDAVNMLLTCSALRDLGAGLALDHFGSVSASLLVLGRLPLTAVKLDQGLISALPHDREATALVRAAIDLAHALDTRVVAMGVQTEQQRAFLARLGCDEAQGPLFGGPMDANAFRTSLVGS